MIDRIYSINNLVRIKSKSDTFMLCLKKSFPFSFFFFSLQNPLRHPVCIVCTCAHRMQAKAPRIELSKRVPWNFHARCLRTALPLHLEAATEFVHALEIISFENCRACTNCSSLSRKLATESRRLLLRNLWKRIWLDQSSETYDGGWRKIINSSSLGNKRLYIYIFFFKRYKNNRKLIRSIISKKLSAGKNRRSEESIRQINSHSRLNKFIHTKKLNSLRFSRKRRTRICLDSPSQLRLRSWPVNGRSLYFGEAWRNRVAFPLCPAFSNAIAEAFSGQLLGNRTRAIISLPRFHLSLPCQLYSFLFRPTPRAPRIHGVTLPPLVTPRSHFEKQHVRFTRLTTLN